MSHPVYNILLTKEYWQQ